MKVIARIVLLLSLVGGFTHEVSAADEAFIISGRMMFTELEGGCWYLETDRGEKYQLTGSTTDIERTHSLGRMLRMKVVRADNIMSACMIGPFLRIVEIYDTVGYPSDQPYIFQKLNSRVYKTKNGCYYVKFKKQRYELSGSYVPAKFRKRGARLSGTYKVLLGKSATECGLEGVVLFEAPPANRGQKMKEIRKDPR